MVQGRCVVQPHMRREGVNPMLGVNVFRVVVRQAAWTDKSRFVVVGVGETVDGFPAEVVLREARVEALRVPGAREVADDVVEDQAKALVRSAYEVGATYSASSVTFEGAALGVLRQATAELRLQDGAGSATEDTAGRDPSRTLTDSEIDLMRKIVTVGFELPPTLDDLRKMAQGMGVGQMVPRRSFWGGILADLDGVLASYPQDDLAEEARLALDKVRDKVAMMEGFLGKFLPPPPNKSVPVLPAMSAEEEDDLYQKLAAAGGQNGPVK